MDHLQEYVRRRNFGKTPEPPPRKSKRATASGAQAEELRFVVQAHAARAMHYDFRLQMGDALVSWAVPKGPSLNPKHRRLAVLTEDHPLSYIDFEGIIPQGQYGGGSVIIWDQGSWKLQDGGDPRQAFDKGKLTFTLSGEKLHGRFHLNRTRSHGRKMAQGARRGS